MTEFSSGLVRYPNFAWETATKALKHTSAGGDFVLLGFRPNAWYVPLSSLEAHAYIVGPSNAGKTSRVLSPLTEQLIAAGKPVWCVDCKPDPLLAGHMRAACEAAGRPFRFFSLQPGVRSEFSLDFFQAITISGRTPGQVAELLLPSLGLDQSREPYFASQNRNALKAAIELAMGDGRLTFKAIAHHLRKVLQDDRFEHATQALDAVEEMADVPDLNADKQQAQDFAELVRQGEVCYFCLPVTTELKRTSAATASLLLKLTVAVNKDLALAGESTKRLFFIIDEFQDVANGSDLADLLGQVRGIGGGISLILAHQVVEQLEHEGLSALLMSVGLVILFAPRAHAKVLQEWSGERIELMRSTSYSYTDGGMSESLAETIRPALSLDEIQALNSRPGFAVTVLQGGAPTPSFFPHHVTKQEAARREASAFPPRTASPRVARRPAQTRIPSSAPVPRLPAPKPAALPAPKPAAKSLPKPQASKPVQKPAAPQPVLTLEQKLTQLLQKLQRSTLITP